jgi:type II secretory pathway pseudopilin PulG
MTLVELILVMALMLALLSMTVPQLGRFSRGRVLDANARSLLAMLQRGADISASQADPCRVHIDADAGLCRLMESREGRWSPRQTSSLDQLQLPEGLGIRLQSLDSTQASPATQALDAVEFFPDGRCSPCLITLTDQAGDRIHLVARSPLEPFVVTRQQPKNLP